MILTLSRLYANAKEGTFGSLQINNVPICWTLEPYCNGNAPNRSCVPAQPYNLAPYTSQRYGQTWEVVGVPGRTFILFHAGNTVKDTQGCILPGLQVGVIAGWPAVLGSRKALSTVLASLNENDPPHQLIIKERF